MKIINKIQNKSAFTLVELLVVMAIIVALISILVPSLGVARQAANKLYCLNNLKQLGITFNSYVVQYKVYPVCVPDVNLTWEQFLKNPSAIAKGRMLGVPVSLWPYHQEPKLYNCPNLVRKGATISYCYDSRAGRQITTQTAFASLGPSNMPPEEPKKIDYELLTPDRVKQPRAFILLYDLPPAAQDNTELFKNIDPDDDNSPQADSDSQGYLFNYDNKPAGPHSDGFNVLFADLHVKWFKKWNSTELTRKPD